MPGRSTIKDIYLLKLLIKKYWEKKIDLYMIFIDLEKAYDKISRDLLCWVLENKGISINYINVIKEMYDNVATRVRTIGTVYS